MAGYVFQPFQCIQYFHVVNGPSFETFPRYIFVVVYFDAIIVYSRSEVDRRKKT